MDLQTITSVDRKAAAEAFLEYRDAFAQDHQDLDAELMRGYHALSQGKQLIRLSETITAGGFDDTGRPKLAIARADETTITFERWERRLTYMPVGGRVRTGDRRFTVGNFNAVTNSIWSDTWHARIPLIPPRLRPKIKLLNFHILWEAEWYAARRGVRAPHDPALLKRIGGDLFAVLAVWDLTDLERAVLEMRG